jgi:hypothetical protein
VRVSLQRIAQGLIWTKRKIHRGYRIFPHTILGRGQRAKPDHDVRLHERRRRDASGAGSPIIKTILIPIINTSIMRNMNGHL